VPGGLDIAEDLDKIVAEKSRASVRTGVQVSTQDLYKRQANTSSDSSQGMHSRFGLGLLHCDIKTYILTPNSTMSIEPHYYVAQSA
jgi:hypothetical protein